MSESLNPPPKPKAGELPGRHEARGHTWRGSSRRKGGQEGWSSKPRPGVLQVQARASFLKSKDRHNQEPTRGQLSINYDNYSEQRKVTDNPQVTNSFSLAPQWEWEGYF